MHFPEWCLIRKRRRNQRDPMNKIFGSGIFPEHPLPNNPLSINKSEGKRPTHISVSHAVSRRQARSNTSRTSMKALRSNAFTRDSGILNFTASSCACLGIPASACLVHVCIHHEMHQLGDKIHLNIKIMFTYLEISSSYFQQTPHYVCSTSVTFIKCVRGQLSGQTQEQGGYQLSSCL